jgi:hypothetical protein
MATRKTGIRKQVHSNPRGRMTRKRMVDHANNDTPSNVQVHDSLYGLSIWALGRFGVAVVFAYATVFVYQDQRDDQIVMRQMQKDTQVILEKFLEARAEDRQVIRNLTQVVERLGVEFEQAHRKLNN